MTSSKHINENIIKKIIKSTFNYFGYQIKKKNNFMDKHSEYIAEANQLEMNNLNIFEKKCLASKSNLWSIYQSIYHIKNKNISGDIVECGIYNGYTLTFIYKLLKENNIDRLIWGYDSFEDGFFKDTISSKDKVSIKNKSFDITNDKTTFFTIDQVKSNIKQLTNFNDNKIKFIKGNIINTLQLEKNIPKQISFLRMDTDIYETTKTQLEILYPRLSNGGVLHIDDYGWMSGVKDAVDKYFKDKKIWLHRVDLTCRYLIKEE